MPTANAHDTMEPRPTGRPRFILHAGTHKTGTTSIQSALKKHRDHLRAFGFLYPDGQVPFGADAPHHKFAHALTGVSENDVTNAATFVAALEADLRLGETAIVSAEPFYRHQHGQEKQDFSIDPGTYWDKRLRYLEAARKVLAPFDVEVLLYFRARDRFAESWYWHSILEIGPQPPFPEFVESFAPWFDYDRQVAVFRSVFDSVRVESYEAACAARGGLVAEFFRTIGCVPPPGFTEERRREGQYGGDAFATPAARAAFLARYPDVLPR